MFWYLFICLFVCHPSLQLNYANANMKIQFEHWLRQFHWSIVMVWCDEIVSQAIGIMKLVSKNP